MMVKAIGDTGHTPDLACLRRARQKTGIIYGFGGQKRPFFAMNMWNKRLGFILMILLYSLALSGLSEPMGKHMKKFAAGFLALALVLAATAPAHAARVFVGVGGYGYPYPAYGYYPGYYPYPYYVAPPPVVYAVPPPPPTMIAPAPVTYAVAPTPLGAPVVAANQTSPTFIDSLGRTCRHFQSTSGGAAYGTACLQPDGSWRSVP
jgi:hypothetical protein